MTHTCPLLKCQTGTEFVGFSREQRKSKPRSILSHESVLEPAMFRPGRRDAIRAIQFMLDNIAKARCFVADNAIWR